MLRYNMNIFLLQFPGRLFFNLIDIDWQNHLNQNLFKIVGLCQNEVMSFATKWLELENIMPSEMPKKDKYHDCTYMWNFKKQVK